MSCTWGYPGIGVLSCPWVYPGTGVLPVLGAILELVPYLSWGYNGMVSCPELGAILELVSCPVLGAILELVSCQSWGLSWNWYHALSGLSYCALILSIFMLNVALKISG